MYLALYADPTPLRTRHIGLASFCREKMAGSMMQKVAFGLFCWLMIAYATVLGLIGLALTVIRYPTTAFKSKKRNCERRFIPRWSCRGVSILRMCTCIIHINVVLVCMCACTLWCVVCSEMLYTVSITSCLIHSVST